MIVLKLQKFGGKNDRKSVKNAKELTVVTYANSMYDQG